MVVENMICIRCPKGCPLEVMVEKGKEAEVKGNLCQQGVEFAREEINDPKRNIATSIPVNGKHFRTLSVRLSGDIPRKRIEEVLECINKINITPPVRRGDVIIRDILDLGVDVIATRSVI